MLLKDVIIVGSRSMNLRRTSHPGMWVVIEWRGAGGMPQKISVSILIDIFIPQLQNYEVI